MNSERMKKFISLLLAGSMALGLLLPGVSAFAEDGDEQPPSEPSVAQTLVEKITEAAAAAAQNESPPAPETPSQPDTPPQGDPEPVSESPGEPPAPPEGTDPEPAPSEPASPEPDAPGVTEGPAQPEQPAPPEEEKPPAPPEEEKPPEEPTPAEQKEKEQELEEARAHRSDPAADVEIPSEWAAMFEKLDLTGKYPDDLLAVARTQIGYAESEANYAETEDQRRGYTRYGAWSQDPYAPWNLTFLAFCLEYAQVPEDAFPREDDPETWRQTLTEQNLWTTEAPKPGDVAFLPEDPEAAVEEETKAALVAIVDEIEEDGTLWVIAGDMENEVRRIELASDQIIGFGVLPPGEERQDPPPTDPASTDVPADNGEPPADYDAPQAPLDPAAPAGDLAGDLAQRIAEAIQPETPPAEEPQPEELPEEVPAETFVRAQTVDEVTVTVTATPGTFPEDAALSVTRVPVAAQIAVDAAVAPQRDGSTVAASYTFDVTMLDGQGSPLQPADGGTVRVSFSMAEVADANLAPRVYHIEGEGEDLSAQALDVETEGDTATVVTEGFSYYTVEFTYNNMQYVLEGGATVPLADILAFVGLSGEVTDVEVSAPDLFSAELADGQWVIVSHGPFTSEEWMKVTIDGGVYEIVVTDEFIVGWTISTNLYAWLDSQPDGNYKLIIRANKAGGGVGGNATITKNITSARDWPWYSAGYSSQISSVEFNAHITVGEGKNIRSMFEGCTNLKSVSFSTDNGSFNTSNATNMSRMFYNCSSLTTIEGITNLETNNVQDMSSMFYGCNRLTELDLSKWTNNGKLYNIQNMFNGCTSLKKLVLNNPEFKTRPLGSDGTSGGLADGLTGIFSNCSELEELDMSNITLNLRNGDTTFKNLFYGTQTGHRIKKVDFHDLSVTNITDLSNMFNGCTNLEELNLSRFGSPKTEVIDGEEKTVNSLESLTTMKNFVQGCTSLTTLYMDNLDISSIKEETDNGAARVLGLESCTSLNYLSARNSKIWMVKAQTKSTGDHQYWNATGEDTSGNIPYIMSNGTDDIRVYYTPDVDSNQKILLNKREWIDLLTDRYDTTGVDYDGQVLQGRDFSTNPNANLAAGHTNTAGAGFLAPGVYESTTDTKNYFPSVPWTDYRINNVGNGSFPDVLINEINYSDELYNGASVIIGDLVITKNEDGTIQIDTVKKNRLAWGNTSYTINKDADNGGIYGGEYLIRFVYKEAATDIHGDTHDVILTVNKIRFNDLDRIPSSDSYPFRPTDPNYNHVIKQNGSYYRRLFYVTPSELQFRDYVRMGDTYALSNGSGSEVDFEIKIAGVERTDNSSVLFFINDLDVPNRQEWIMDANDGNLDELPWSDDVTTVGTHYGPYYGVDSEGIVLDPATNYLDTLTFATHSGLAQLDRGGTGNYIVPTGPDQTTPWSSFYVAADAAGANYTWTNGVGCTTYFLLNQELYPTAEEQYVDLKIQKNVVQNNFMPEEDKTKDWVFTLTLKDDKGRPITTLLDEQMVDAGVTWVESNRGIGEYKFTLKDKGWLEITKLPQGAKYTITEESGPGYSVTYQINNGTSVGSNTTGEQTLEETSTVLFTNTSTWSDSLPSTGGAGLPILIKLALGSMVLTTPVTWIKRKWGVGG